MEARGAAPASAEDVVTVNFEPGRMEKRSLRRAPLKKGLTIFWAARFIFECFKVLFRAPHPKAEEPQRVVRRTYLRFSHKQPDIGKTEKSFSRYGGLPPGHVAAMFVGKLPKSRGSSPRTDGLSTGD